MTWKKSYWTDVAALAVGAVAFGVLSLEAPSAWAFWLILAAILTPVLSLAMKTGLAIQKKADE